MSIENELTAGDSGSGILTEPQGSHLSPVSKPGLPAGFSFMNNGWIKLHRDLLFWEWFRDRNTLQLFLYLLLKANHATRKWQGITIERGQCVTGRTQIEEDTGLTEQQIRTSTNKLKSTGSITLKTTNKYSIVTICKYDTYQNSETEINQDINTQDNTQSTPKQHPSNHKQECKNVRMEEVQTPIVPQGDDVPADLELFSDPPQPPPEPNGKHLTEARVLVHYLNEKAGRQHRETDKNLKLITSRLKEPGVTVDGVKQMIDHQVAQWGRDQQMRKYLRVETLFRESKFESYYASRNERVATVKPF